MPRRPKPPAKAVSTPELEVPKELLDELVKGPTTQGDLESMFRSLKKAVIERAMSAEMSEHLGYRQGESKPEGQGNQRNGTSGRTVITDDGPVRIEVPRDRDGSSEPKIIGKHERRFTGFDQKIIAMYARGMTVREIQGYLARAVVTSPATRRRRSSCGSPFATSWAAEYDQPANGKARCNRPVLTALLRESAS
jgi:putative transposase